jgi:protocatechuate 3,4-dioxygenase, beta subunit
MLFRKLLLLCAWSAVATAAAALAQSGPPPTPEPPGRSERASANVSSSGTIAPPREPGERLVLSGQLVAPDGNTPAAGVIVYAYQTDATGEYHNIDQVARLHGWAKSDRDGHFEFRTIRPAPYPGRTIPAHIHMHAWGAGYPLQWTPELKFADDPLLSAKDRAESESLGSGFSNICSVTRDAGGVWHCAIRLRLLRQTNYPAQYRDDPRTRP